MMLMRGAHSEIIEQLYVQKRFFLSPHPPVSTAPSRRHQPVLLFSISAVSYFLEYVHREVIDLLHVLLRELGEYGNDVVCYPVLLFQDEMRK
jgi:hypothetical protein